MNWANRIEAGGRNQRDKLRMFNITQMAAMVSGFERAGHVSVNMPGNSQPSMSIPEEKRMEHSSREMSTIHTGKKAALCQTQGPFPS